MLLVYLYRIFYLVVCFWYDIFSCPTLSLSLSLYLRWSLVTNFLFLLVLNILICIRFWRILTFSMYRILRWQLFSFRRWKLFSFIVSIEDSVAALIFFLQCLFFTCFEDFLVLLLCFFKNQLYMFSCSLLFFLMYLFYPN